MLHNNNIIIMCIFIFFILIKHKVKSWSISLVKIIFLFINISIIYLFAKYTLADIFMQIDLHYINAFMAVYIKYTQQFRNVVVVINNINEKKYYY